MGHPFSSLGDLAQALVDAAALGDVFVTGFGVGHLVRGSSKEHRRGRGGPVSVMDVTWDSYSPLAADEGIAFDDEAQRVFDGLADANAGGGANQLRLEAVIEDLERGGAAGDVESVVGGAGDVEGLAEASWAGGEQTRSGVGGQLAQARHGGKSFDGLEGADKNAARTSFGLAGDVQAVVHSVDEVDVGDAGGAEEDSVAGGLAVVGVRRGIVESEIGFDLDYASSEPFIFDAAGDELAKEPAGDNVGRVEVEAVGLEFRHRVQNRDAALSAKTQRT